MVKLDLIPPDLRYFKPHSGPYCVAAGVAIIVAMLMMWGLAEVPRMRSRRVQAERSVRSMQAIWSVYRQALDQVAKLEEEQKALLAEAQELSDLAGRPIQAGRVLHELATVLPAPVWGERLTFDFDRRQGELVCAAWGDVGPVECMRFVETLAKNPALSAGLDPPRLASHKAQQDGIRKQMDFTVRFVSDAALAAEVEEAAAAAAKGKGRGGNKVPEKAKKK